MLNDAVPSSQMDSLIQSIVNEMKAQGVLDDFTNDETGEALLSIQFPDDLIACKVAVNTQE